jgi:hypothetical protein
VKEFHEEGTQFNLRTKETWAQTDGHFVAATELCPPELENDSKGMGCCVTKVNTTMSGKMYYVLAFRKDENGALVRINWGEFFSLYK